MSDMTANIAALEKWAEREDIPFDDASADKDFVNEFNMSAYAAHITHCIDCADVYALVDAAGDLWIWGDSSIARNVTINELMATTSDTIKTQMEASEDE